MYVAQVGNVSFGSFLYSPHPRKLGFADHVDGILFRNTFLASPLSTASPFFPNITTSACLIGLTQHDRRGRLMVTY